MALHKYLINIKIVYFALFILQMKLFVFPKMKWFETKNFSMIATNICGYNWLAIWLSKNVNNEKDTRKNH